ncbi:Arabinose operon regulatory protein [Paenibacillus solanacearum]|uniref:Arabinose operon regulatory protein n=1 Tax=Paenibacillus solanacearum TaxID=2048548 RepID=A0A916K6K0_9BACL|nr:AraC family transcriptional regulator [Paenibacillus solanacearum]CAG7647756.1 Arabinose operon regulatory protein [Paenibacillus solanacearum]
MKKNILVCGFSYHTSKFYTSHRGQGLGSYLIRLQTEGAGVVSVNGRESRLAPGDVLLLPPGTLYELRIGEEPAADPSAAKIASGDYYLFCLNDQMIAWWNRAPRKWKYRIEPSEMLLSLWKQLILEKHRLSEDNRELTAHLLGAFCLYLDRAIHETDPAQSRPYTAARMKRYVEAHAMETFALEDVAKHVGLSVSRAVHLFKESYGKTMIQYAMDIRLSGAVDRMNYTSMTLGQISDSCGFKSYTFFHKVFKEKYGISPAAYRSKVQEMLPVLHDR